MTVTSDVPQDSGTCCLEKDVDTPFLGMIRARVDGALSNLVLWEVSLTSRKYGREFGTRCL